MSNPGLEDFADIIVSELKSYTDEKTSKINKAAKKIGRKARRTVKSKSPKLTGDYEKGWKVSIISDTPSNISICVHQKGKESSLTHLLEDGHKSKSGGRVKAIPHIQKVNDEANAELSVEIDKILEE